MKNLQKAPALTPGNKGINKGRIKHIFSDSKSEKTEFASFLSEPDEATKKNSTGIDSVKAPKISVSEIQDEGTFEETNDDEFVWAMRSFSALTEELEKDGSVEFQDSGLRSQSECPDIRSYTQIGDIFLKSSKDSNDGIFAVKVLNQKVIPTHSFKFLFPPK